MKNNNNMINSDAVCLKNDTAAGDSYRQTWANYIVKWLEAFAAQGIDMWGLTPQNEPGARQGRFESCAYDVPHYVDFVGNYLGPTVHATFPHLQIMGFDHNKQDSLSYMDALYSDANASTHVAGTGELCSYLFV
jgi:glucosylceramidase